MADSNARPVPTPGKEDPFAKDDADQAHEQALAAAAKAHEAAAPAAHETGLIQALKNFMQKERAGASMTQSSTEEPMLKQAQMSDSAPAAASQGVASAPGNSADY